MDAFAQIYFINISHDLQAFMIIQLTVSLNFSEITCLRELIQLAIKNSLVTENFFIQIWKIFLRKPEEEIKKKQFKSIEETQIFLKCLINESRAAFQLLNIGGEFDSNILLSKSELLIKHILTSDFQNLTIIIIINHVKVLFVFVINRNYKSMKYMIKIII